LFIAFYGLLPEIKHDDDDDDDDALSSVDISL